MIGAMGGSHPYVLISGIVLVTSLLTTFLSNNAVAVIMTPIVLEMAHHLDLSTKPFMIAVAVGASACFASPIGYQTNALVYGAGGYQFRDFIRVGLPLNLLIWLVASIVIPFFWPLEGAGKPVDVVVIHQPQCSQFPWNRRPEWGGLEKLKERWLVHLIPLRPIWGAIPDPAEMLPASRGLRRIPLFFHLQ